MGMFEDVSLIIAGTRVTVASSPVGRGHFPFNPDAFPPMTAELRNVFDLSAREPDRLMPDGVTPARSFLQQLGIKLYSSVLGAWGEYRLAVDQAADTDKKVNLSLLFVDTPVSAYPWELMFDPVTQSYLALSGAAISRSAPAVSPPPAYALQGPLRALIFSAQPTDAGALTVEGELQAVVEGLERSAHGVEIAHAAGTFENLQAALQDGGPWHVLHFIGHGIFDHGRGGGVLTFEDANRKAVLVDAGKLSRLVSSHQALRLVVLSSCQTGASDGRQDVVSMAEALLRATDLSAVVTMQFQVTNWAAQALAEYFYGALALTGDVNHAVAAARAQLAQLQPPTQLSPEGLPSFEWSTPVVYQESSGPVFDGMLASRPEAPALTIQAPDPTAPDGSLRDGQDGSWVLAANLPWPAVSGVLRLRSAIDSLGEAKYEMRPDGLVAHFNPVLPVVFEGMATTRIDGVFQPHAGGSSMTVTCKSTAASGMSTPTPRDLLLNIAAYLGVAVARG